MSLRRWLWKQLGRREAQPHGKRLRWKTGISPRNRAEATVCEFLKSGIVDSDALAQALASARLREEWFGSAADVGFFYKYFHREARAIVAGMLDDVLEEST